jgi:hypothetical protein
VVAKMAFPVALVVNLRLWKADSPSPIVVGSQVRWLNNLMVTGVLGVVFSVPLMCVPVASPMIEVKTGNFAVHLGRDRHRRDR